MMLLKFILIYSCSQSVVAGYWKQFNCGVEQRCSIRCSVTSIGYRMSHFSFIVKQRGPYVDVAHTHREVQMIKATLRMVPSGVNSFQFRMIHTQDSQSVDIKVSIPRLASRQQYCQHKIVPITIALTLQFHCWITESLNWIFGLMNLHRVSLSSCAYCHQQSLLVVVPVVE